MAFSMHIISHPHIQPVGTRFEQQQVPVAAEFASATALPVEKGVDHCLDLIHLRAGVKQEYRFPEQGVVQ